MHRFTFHRFHHRANASLLFRAYSWYTVLCLFSLLLLFSSCLPIQSYRHITPDQKDVHRFTNAEVAHASNCFEFKEDTAHLSFQVSNWSNEEALCALPLNDFLKQHHAIHFIVLRNDTIVYEYKNPTFKDDALIPSFSLAKSLVSATLGVAIQQGKIRSINDLVKSYIPELNYHEYFNTLTINHLLNQKSGLRMEVDVITHANYGKIEKILPMLHFDAKPGEHLEYININSTLMGIILERATGQDLHQYFADHIWTKIGTCDSTVWGYDRRSNHTRAMSSFGASARDYAKFGLLYLNKGQWGEEQVVDSNWVKASTQPVNALGDELGYNNNWFIGESQVGDYMIRGMYRQQIYINPKERTVMVCFLKFYEPNRNMNWWAIFRQLSHQANQTNMPFEENTVLNR